MESIVNSTSQVQPSFEKEFEPTKTVAKCAHIVIFNPNCSSLKKYFLRNFEMGKSRETSSGYGFAGKIIDDFKAGYF